MKYVEKLKPIITIEYEIGDWVTEIYKLSVKTYKIDSDELLEKVNANPENIHPARTEEIFRAANPFYDISWFKHQ